MAANQSENNKSKDNNEEGALKPDPETLHTTDPQEHMEGPISSLVKKTGENLDSDESADEDETKEDKE